MRRNPRRSVALCICLCGACAPVVLARQDEPRVAQIDPHAGSANDQPAPAPELSPAVRRMLDEPYLTDAERRALRIRHGVWEEGDVTDPSDPNSGALAALTRLALDAPVLRDERTSPLLRARACLLRGEINGALALLDAPCKDPSEAPLGALYLRAACLDASGRAQDADAALEPLVARMKVMASSRDLPKDADEIAQGVRGLILRARLRGPAGSDGGDFKDMMGLLARARDEVDPLSWQVPLAEAQLLLDKDNYADAAAALTAALTLNPSAAEAWTLLGQMSVNAFDFARAERIAARLDALACGREDAARAGASPFAAIVVAGARVRQGDGAGAAGLLDAQMARFPGQRALLASRAAAAAVMFDFADTDRRLAAIDVLAPGNPDAWLAVGKAMSDARQYAEAAKYLGEAARRAPRWPTPAIELGLLEMQAGRNDAALLALAAAEKLDTFNVRAANSLKLVREIAGWETVESEHFVVRFKPGVDGILAREMPATLERINARVCGEGPGGIRHQPGGKTVIELMPDHHWFAVRITGMPDVHTIAAATGPLIAMEAPRSGPGHLVGPYLWARVLQHEYTHTVTLSRTKNRLPHWFTEAAAVYLEDSPRDWSNIQLLARTAERDEFFDFDEINLAFIRPKKPTDRQLGYAQGHWMYEYIVTRFGPDAPLALMDLYATGEKEEQAFQRVLGVTREQFLAQFKGWAVEQLVAWGVRLGHDEPSVADLFKAHNDALRDAGEPELDKPTLELVDAWVKDHPKNPALLKAAIELRLQGSGDRVTAELVPWLERYAAACPVDPLPHKLLARYDLDGQGTGQAPESAAAHLRFLAQREQYSPTYAVELSRLYASMGKWDEATANAEQAAGIAPYDASVREFAATVALRRGDRTTAERHIRALIAIEPDRELHKKRLEALLAMPPSAPR